MEIKMESDSLGRRGFVVFPNGYALSVREWADTGETSFQRASGRFEVATLDCLSRVMRRTVESAATVADIERYGNRVAARPVERLKCASTVTTMAQALEDDARQRVVAWREAKDDAEMRAHIMLAAEAAGLTDTMVRLVDATTPGGLEDDLSALIRKLRGAPAHEV